MLSPLSSSWTSPPSSSSTWPESTTNSSSESPCAYGSVPVEPPTSSSPTKTSRCCRGRCVSRYFRPRIPKASEGRSAWRSTRGATAPPGSKRSARLTPSAAAIRWSDAMLALARPRSTWLRKLSLTRARSAIVFSVARRSRRMSRKRSPTSTSATASGALDGIQISLDPVEGKLKCRYGVSEAKSMPAPEAHEQRRRDSPDQPEDDECRHRRPEQERHGKHQSECEREDDVRPRDHNEHDVVQGVEDRPSSRETEQRTS